MSRIRCFVAADLDGPARQEVERLQERLRKMGVRGRWVAPGRVHVTVRFIGEVPPETFDAVFEALARPVGTTGALDLVLQGLGAFPSLRRPRVLWVGLAGDVAALAGAAREVNERLEGLGLPGEARPFRPHVTLARAKGPSGMEGLEQALRALGPYQGPGFRVTRLTLYESRLKPGGPEYLPRRSIPLGGPAA